MNTVNDEDRAWAREIGRRAEARGGDEGGRALDRRLPVPMRHRHDGWTRERQERFLGRLTETGCVRDACAHAGLSSTSAYRAYARMPAFAAAWDRALRVRKPMLEDAAFERAVHGVTVPLTRLGQVVGERRRYSDGLLRYLLERGDRQAAGDAPGGELRRIATREEMDAALFSRLRHLKSALERQKLHDPEAATRREAEDDRIIDEALARQDARARSDKAREETGG